MKLLMPKSWYEKHLKSDDDEYDVRACSCLVGNPCEIAFSQIVRINRISSNLSVLDLSKKISVDCSELELLEQGDLSGLRPRTPYKIERAFNLPKGTLYKLIRTDLSASDQEEVVRFAASAKNFQVLSDMERRALKRFVEFLNSKD